MGFLRVVRCFLPVRLSAEDRYTSSSPTSQLPPTSPTLTRTLVANSHSTSEAAALCSGNALAGNSAPPAGSSCALQEGNQNRRADMNNSTRDQEKESIQKVYLPRH